MLDAMPYEALRRQAGPQALRRRLACRPLFRFVVDTCSTPLGPKERSPASPATAPGRPRASPTTAPDALVTSNGPRSPRAAGRVRGTIGYYSRKQQRDETPVLPAGCESFVFIRSGLSSRRAQSFIGSSGTRRFTSSRSSFILKARPKVVCCYAFRQSLGPYV